MTDSGLIWGWFRRVWRGSPVALSMILVLSLGSATLLTILPWLWQFVIDEVRTTADPVRIQELAVWMAVVGVSHTALYLVLQGTRSVMNSRIQWRARAVVFAHLAQLDHAFHRSWRPGDLVTRMYDDAGEKIAWFLCSGIFRAYEAALIVIVCLGAMVWIDPCLTALVVIPLPLLIVGQAFTQGMLGRRYLAVQQSISAINDELTTTFGGIRIVQSCGLQATTRRRFTDAADRLRIAEVRVAVVQQAVFMLYGYGWQLALVALLLAGGHGVLAERITLGQYVTFEGFVMTLVWPMFDVGMFVSRFKQAGVALARLQVLLDELGAPAPGDADPTDAGLEADAVSVAAEDGTPLLRDVSVRLAPGETLAVVGEVGAGKSVLLQLLAGARTPAGGTVRFGERDATALSAAARQRVAYVPQDPVLLSAPLRENILLGRDVDDADLSHALEVSRLGQDLPALPDGLDTAVGERGVTLSGGQQQRVALARALVSRPHILLLDDATAALDADTEAAFWAQIDRVLPDVTAVVVTHRVSTIQRADAVLVLEGGAVVQRGRHADLVAQEGAYRRIYGRLQARERVSA